jgi:DUF1365 family protein
MKPLHAPLCLFEGLTVHCRYTPYRRRFSFRFAQVLVDIDRIGAGARGRSLFSYNTPNLVSLYDKDHGDRSGAPLRAWAEQRFADAHVTLDGGAIRLLCFPRVFGFVFNPISIFFGYGPNGDLRGAIYEVNNTFGDTHAYVARFDGDAPAPHEAQKQLYVSPFFRVEGAYTFRLKGLDDTLLLTIENTVDGARTHFATLAVKRAPLTDARLAKMLITLPFMTLAVVAGIHWHAFFIWLRGARYHKRPIKAAPHATQANLSALPVSQ